MNDHPTPHPRVKAIMEWQEDFKKAPLLWYTMQFYEGQQEHTGNFYDSKEAAQIEVDRYPKRRLKIYAEHIHNLDLSERRWNELVKKT